MVTGDRKRHNRFTLYVFFPLQQFSFEFIYSTSVVKAHALRLPSYTVFILHALRLENPWNFSFVLLVSFSGDYLSHDDVSNSSLNNIEDDDPSRTLDHQLLKICVPRTKSNLFGPAFIEFCKVLWSASCFKSQSSLSNNEKPL
ncbi:hypothetical protein AgCh_038564 [Apium graveolens]